MGASSPSLQSTGSSRLRLSSQNHVEYDSITPGRRWTCLPTRNISPFESQRAPWLRTDVCQWSTEVSFFGAQCHSRRRQTSSDLDVAFRGRRRPRSRPGTRPGNCKAFGARPNSFLFAQGGDRAYTLDSDEQKVSDQVRVDDVPRPVFAQKRLMAPINAVHGPQPSGVMCAGLRAQTQDCFWMHFFFPTQHSVGQVACPTYTTTAITQPASSLLRR